MKVAKSCLSGLAGIVISWCAYADVDVDSLLQESAMWLDASDPALFQLNASGGVTNWINRSTSGRATYGDAKAYHVDPSTPQHFGSVELVNGAPAYQMFNTGSYVDLTYGRISTIRTAFLVGDFENVSNGYNPLLGDSVYCNFHRGQSGEFISDKSRDYKGTITAWLNSATTKVTPSSTKPTTGAMNFIILATAGDTKSDLLSGDRTRRDPSPMPKRSAGRALHEVIIFTRALTDAERSAVYDYLYAKWHEGGWDKGQYETLATYGGPTAVSFMEDATVGAATDAEKRLLAKTVSVAEGKTATLAGPLTAGSVNLTGGGTLVFDHGAVINGKLAQAGGTLDLGGGSFTSFLNPAFSGTVTLRDGVFDMRSRTERFRPSAGTHVILGEGGSLVCNYDIFPDQGNVVFEMTEQAGVVELLAGCFGLTVDSATSNTFVLAGGTLVSTNYAADVSDNFKGVIKILTQNLGGTAVMNMTGGAILARRISVAGSWTAAEKVSGRAYVDITGGTITLGDDFAIGANNGTHGRASVHFGGGTVTAPNGLHMYYNDSDAVTFDGTTFVATKDNANYFNFAKPTSANVSVAEGGFILDDSGFAVGVDFSTVSGTGPVVKRGAGTLTLGNVQGFAGSLTVEAGTVVLATDSTQLALNMVTLDGANAKLVLGLKRFMGPFAVGAGGTLDVIVTKSGFNAIALAAAGLDVSKLALIVRNEQGTVLPDATAEVQDGVFGVRMPESYVADVAGVTADWFALPWTFGGVATDFPTEDGVVVEAVLNASGASEISLGKTVHSPLTKVRNADVNAARITLKGPAEHVGRLDLADFTGTVRAERANVGGEIALGEQSVFELHAAEGETWTGGVYRVTGGAATKTGAGTVVHAGIPDGAIEVTDGVLGLLVTEDASVASLNVTSASKAGILEKRGAGKLTLTGMGPSDVQIKVLEGTFAIDRNMPSDTMRDITATAEKPFYVGPGAAAVIDGDNNHTRRLPPDANIVVDNGTLIVRGTNPYDPNDHLPVVGVTGGVIELNHNVGGEHIKFKSLTLKDSTFKFTGTKGAYNSEGTRMRSPYAINTSGTCLFDRVEGNNNKFMSEGEVQLAVADGTTTWNIPTKNSANVRKTGAGALRFGPNTASSETTFIIAEGVVVNGVAGGACAKLQFANGSTLKAADGDPLKVTTITLPSSGAVTLDLTGIDFTDREDPVTILDCAAFTSAMAEKLTVVGMPGAPWEISTSGGITVKRIAQPQNLVWDTGDGQWTATAWNNDPAGYGMDGYHHVSFADRVSGTAGSPVTVTIPEDRFVSGFDFTAATTPYRLAGAGIVTMPTFSITGMAGFAVETPISVTQGTFIFAPTAADQAVLDLRGTIGGITVPAAAGGTVKLGFTDASSTDVGAITIGSGKTLELFNGRKKDASSPRLNGVISGDETTLLKITAGPGNGHFDHYSKNTAFKGRIEIADGGFLYMGSSGKTGQGSTYRLSFGSSPEQPFYIHGADSTARFYSSANNHYVMTENAYFRVEDGGKLQLSGVNLQADQAAGPSVVVSNAFMQAQDGGSAHIHIRDVNLYDKGVLELTHTTTAYKNQGLCIWDKIVAVEGESIVRRDDGSPNHYCFYRGSVSSSSTREGEIEVREDARVVFDNASFADAPHKTGEGTLVLGERASVFGTSARTLKLDEGYMLANAMTETTNANLTAVQVADGAGFDLSELKGLPWTPAFELTATNETTRTTIVLKLPAGQLKGNTKVISWTKAPNAVKFRSESEKNCVFAVRDDGLYAVKGLMVFFK